MEPYSPVVAEATMNVPIMHRAKEIKRGTLQFGDLSVKWAITRAEVIDIKPCTVSKAVVKHWV